MISMVPRYLQELLCSTHGNRRKRIFSKIKLVEMEPGASAVSCTVFILSLGVKRENLVMCDKRRLHSEMNRPDLDYTKKEFSTARDIQPFLIA